MVEKLYEPRIVNVIGNAPQAAVNPVIGENWGINQAYNFCPKLDKWFLIDGLKAEMQLATEIGIGEAGFMEYAMGFKGEMFSYYDEKILDTSNKNKVLVECKSIPHNAIRTLVGTMFTSSMAWILGYIALQEKLGFKKVDLVNLHGIEVWISHDGQEYGEQTECINFWIGYLNGMGIQVNLPAYLIMAAKHSNNLYGFERKE